MQLSLLEKNKEKTKMSFLLKGIHYTYANGLRRLMMNYTPTMAIETVEFRKNSSSLYDEMVAHRLGLLALKTDLKGYKMAETPEEVESAKCSVKLSLKAKGPCTVYASEIKSKDPEIVPVFLKTPIVKLLKGQELEFEALAILGIGVDHVKWCPGLIFYSYEPTVTVNNNSSKFDEVKDKYPPQIFDKKGKIDKSLINTQTLIDACVGVCDDVVKVEYNQENFIFTIESFGQLSCKETMLKALDVFNEKLDNLQKEMVKIE